jgi:hypothetical protein
MGLLIALIFDNGLTELDAAAAGPDADVDEPIEPLSGKSHDTDRRLVG